MFPGQKPKALRKSASDLRSSATARPGQLPHKTHMRLVCLEMERHRKLQEVQNLMARAQRCRERCAEIDVEVRQLMAILDKGRAAAGQVMGQATTSPGTQPAAQAEAKPILPVGAATKEELADSRPFHAY